MGKIQKLRDIIVSRLESRAVTQAGLARATGIDQASINRFYKKGEGLSAENFLRLCAWVGVELVWPGEENTLSTPLSAEGDTREIAWLRDKIDSLQRENSLLHKLVSRYEAEESPPAEHTKNKPPDDHAFYTREP